MHPWLGGIASPPKDHGPTLSSTEGVCSSLWPPLAMWDPAPCFEVGAGLHAHTGSICGAQCLVPDHRLDIDHHLLCRYHIVLSVPRCHEALPSWLHEPHGPLPMLLGACLAASTRGLGASSALLGCSLHHCCQCTLSISRRSMPSTSLGHCSLRARWYPSLVRRVSHAGHVQPACRMDIQVAPAGPWTCFHVLTCGSCLRQALLS